VDLDLDDLVYDTVGIQNLLAYQVQENLLDTQLSSVLFHHVGSEIAGPLDQPVVQYSTRDHLLGLYDGTPPELESFQPSRPLAVGYPDTSISWIQGNGGVAVLAHLFGTFDPADMESDVNAQALAQRVRNARAWGADAMEIGYVQRGRPLQDFVRVWGNLSLDRVYITGIGTSLSVSPSVMVSPGDWLRVEVRDGNDAGFLFSNPIYYTDLGTAPPPDR
jgi:hypothetical protein